MLSVAYVMNIPQNNFNFFFIFNKERFPSGTMHPWFLIDKKQL